MIDQAQQLATPVGVTRACEVLTVPRSSFYRTPGRKDAGPASSKRTAPPWALNSAQRLEVRDVLNSDRFCDQAPRQVWARLLDEGRYLCSWRVEDARAWSRPFFHWYNEEHYHTGLDLLTPATVHYRHHQPIHQQRQQVLEAAYATQPERFVGGRPTVQPLPEAVWINPPKEQEATTEHSSLNSSIKVSQSH